MKPAYSTVGATIGAVNKHVFLCLYSVLSTSLGQHHKLPVKLVHKQVRTKKCLLITFCTSIIICFQPIDKQLTVYFFNYVTFMPIVAATIVVVNKHVFLCLYSVISLPTSQASCEVCPEKGENKKVFISIMN